MKTLASGIMLMQPLGWTAEPCMNEAGARPMPRSLALLTCFIPSASPLSPSAAQVLDDFAAASPEERQEEYEGGTPYSPFVAMLQVSALAGGKPLWQGRMVRCATLQAWPCTCHSCACLC